MSSTVTFNGTSYTIPATGDENWSDNLSLYLIAIASGSLQKTGGTFTLTAEADFGATYGLKSNYFKSRATNPSSTGILRLGNNEGIGFRNAANNADLVLKANASDVLEYNGSSIVSTGSLTDLITNTMVNSSAAIAYSKLNLATSIVNGDISGSAAIALSKLAATTVTRALVSDGSGKIAVASTTAAEIEYVNGVTSSIQTQLDAKIAKSLVTTKGDIITATASATPARQAVGTDGQILVADSTQTNGIKWATANSGSKNYFVYNSFENNATTGWSLGTATLTTNFPSGAPTFGSGASGNLSLSAVAGSTIAGTYALSYASSAATTAGNFVASDAFTIDAEDIAKPLAFKFSYKAAVNPTNCDWSGTTSNSFGVAIYDVTNSAWIQPAGCFNMVQSSGVGIASGSFQTSATGTSYRICVYNANATSGAATVYMDSFFVGPQTLVTGAAITDWVSYTPTFVGLGTVSSVNFRSRRNGDSLQVQGLVTVGTPTSVTASMTLGYNGVSGNVTWDSNKIVAVSSCGSGSIGATPSTTYFNGLNVLTSAASGTTVNFGYQSSTASSMTAALGNALTGAGAVLSVNFSVPIVGWSSNVQLSSDTDTRVIGFRANNSSTTITSSAAKIVWTNTDRDDVGGYSSGTYTVKVTGWYDIDTQLYMTATPTVDQTTIVYIYRNGASIKSFTHRYKVASATTTAVGVSDTYYFNAGDTVEIYALNEGTSPSISSSTTQNTFSVVRRSGPAVVAANETVAALYTGAPPTGTLTAGYNTTTFGTKVRDSHAAYSSGSYTIPVSGIYSISAASRHSATYALGNLAAIAVYIDGTQKASNVAVAGGACGTLHPSVSINSYPLLAGQVVTIRCFNNGTTPSFTSAADENFFSITRTGNY